MGVHCRVYSHIVIYLGRTPIRDWLICGHVTLDKFNVSLEQQVNNHAARPENKMVALNLKVYKSFPSLFKDYII